MQSNDKNAELELISPAFRDGEPIPPQFSCRGQNISPPLNIFNVPPQTRSMAIIMHDPDAVSGDFTHWLIWDIPASCETIAVSSVPVGAIQGVNDSGKRGYTGPCPPSGTGIHRYIFELYALDNVLNLASGSTRQELEEAVRGHTLGSATLTGLFSDGR